MRGGGKGTEGGVYAVLLTNNFTNTHIACILCICSMYVPCILLMQHVKHVYNTQVMHVLRCWSQVYTKAAIELTSSSHALSRTPSSSLTVSTHFPPSALAGSSHIGSIPS